MKRILTAFAILFCSHAYSQSTLSAGDIAIIGWNLDGTDGYAFILLTDIDSGTVINFTDCGWSDNTSAFVCYTGDVLGWTWKADKAYSLGKTITIILNGPGMSTTAGTVSGSAGVLSSIGDQIFAYQGSASSPTFIYGAHNDEAPTSATNSNWSGNVTNNQTSALPNSLTNGTNAMRFHVSSTESDNWQYNCTKTISGTVTVVRSAIMNLSNWNNNNTTAYSTVDPGCSWSITPLPVDLIDFKSDFTSTGDVSLHWSTANEINNSHFSIERSSNGKDFTPVGMVQGNGTSSDIHEYIFIDPIENRFNKTFYYRLNQFDFDGSNEYSKIVKVQLDNHLLDKNHLKVFPNPVKDMLTVQLTDNFEEDLTLELISNEGQVVLNKNVHNSKEIKVNTKNLSPGLYTIKITGYSINYSSWIAVGL